MDEKLTEDQLLEILSDAGEFVEIGSLYHHYKGHLYMVLDLAIIESTNEVGVVYQAEYGAGLTYIRPINSWLEYVEFEGKAVQRFTQAEV